MTTWADFQRYDRLNPHVWKLFERFALEAAKRGKRVGAKAIWEQYPGYGQIFHVRKSQADKTPAPITYPARGGQDWMF